MIATTIQTHRTHTPEPLRTDHVGAKHLNANMRTHVPESVRRPQLAQLGSMRDIMKAQTVAPSPALTRHFELYGELEKAIFGSVVKARRRSDGRMVAIKILDKTLIRKRRSVNDTPVFENAEVELSVLQQSAEHPCENLLQATTVDGGRQAGILHDDEAIYSITPFCDQGELFRALQRGGVMDVSAAANLFDGIVNGVHHLHTQLGYVHNDISPENVFLRTSRSASPVPVVADFGLATPIGQTARPVPGKSAYQAPEVLYFSDRSSVASASSDVFSLGVLFFVMVTGMMPYDRPNSQDCPKYKSLQGGVFEYMKTVSSWGVDACTTLVNEHPEALSLMCDMMQDNADARPTLDEVRVRLSALERQQCRPGRQRRRMGTGCSSTAQQDFSFDFEIEGLPEQDDEVTMFDFDDIPSDKMPVTPWQARHHRTMDSMDFDMYSGGSTSRHPMSDHNAHQPPQSIALSSSPIYGTSPTGVADFADENPFHCDANTNAHVL